MTDKSTPAPRQSYHHGDLRAALIAAADGLLRESGTWTFTLREVARAAGVSHNAPYNHFSDKRALLAAVATPGFVALREDLTVAVSDKSADRRDQIIALALAYVRFGVTNSAMFRLMFSEDLARSDDLPDLHIATVAAFDVLQRTMAGDLLGSADINALAAWALVHGLTILVLDGRVAAAEQTDALDSLVAQVAQTLLDGSAPLRV